MLCTYSYHSWVVAPTGVYVDTPPKHPRSPPIVTVHVHNQCGPLQLGSARPHNHRDRDKNYSRIVMLTVLLPTSSPAYYGSYELSQTLLSDLASACPALSQGLAFWSWFPTWSLQAWSGLFCLLLQHVVSQSLCRPSEDSVPAKMENRLLTRNPMTLTSYAFMFSSNELVTVFIPNIVKEFY